MNSSGVVRNIRSFQSSLSPEVVLWFVNSYQWIIGMTVNKIDANRETVSKGITSSSRRGHISPNVMRILWGLHCGTVCIMVGAFIVQ